MLDLLLQRPTVITLAVIGGILSLIASLCAAQGLLSERSCQLLNKAAYAFMGLSMVLFVLASLMGPQTE